MKKKHILNHHDRVTPPFIWENFTKKIHQKIMQAFNQGTFKNINLENRAVRYVQSQKGDPSQGALIEWHWLVDLEDGSLIDAKYLFYGPTILVAICESLVELTVSKGYDFASTLRTCDIEAHLDLYEDHPLIPQIAHYLNLAIDSLENSMLECSDIALAEPVVISPLPETANTGEPSYPNWKELTKKEQLAILRSVIDKEIRPYVEMDSGGVDVLRIENDYTIIIVYSGACDGCYASTGATLNSIQAILKAKIHPNLKVQPEL